MRQNRIASLLLLVIFPFAGPSVGGAGLPDIDGCLVRPRGVERNRCIEQEWSGRTFGESDLRELKRLLDKDPAAADSLASWLESERSPDLVDDRLRAGLLDLHGQALLRLGRHAEAAEVLVSALGISDGTLEVQWLDSSGESRWNASLDVGDGRLIRASRALLLAGKQSEAKRTLARALGLGADNWAREGWALVGGGPVPGLDARPTDLLAPPWFRSLPDLEIPILDGETFRLASARGKIVLLDFWASWCTPCLKELPHLQALHDVEKERGLVAVAVNAQEPESTARSTARSLGLTLPIGIYDEAVDEAFNVRTLPTVVLADRHGRIRSRWDGYTAGLERRIAKEVRSLLGDDPGGAPQSIATVLEGAGRLGVRWRRELPMAPGGVAVIAAVDGTPRVAACGRGRLVILGPDGEVRDKLRAPPEAAKLVRGDLDGDGLPELIGFRSGAQGVVLLDTESDRHTVWEAPSSLMDVAVLAAPAGEPSKGRLVLAGLGGLYLADRGGERVQRLEGAGLTTGVAVTAEGTAARVVALDSNKNLRWHDADGERLATARAPRDGWHVIVSHDSATGAGVLPSTVTAAVTGDFLGGDEPLLAAATASGQLVLRRLADGESRFRARWPGIRELAAADLDGDGTQELLVADGRSLTVLEGVPVVPE